ncbi:MAG: helix-turn-helix transcriptional regulator [Saprospiraceae bacterium]|nr:helix-turn-helix transcriptional regulator [Bacteroidia bacterium]NNE13756.1 helix-turn-helix transcriptional regulator [Saprospiraceae bacterium]NNL93579.1 helix-turn-helix transcriptional regulator [Saprospiraceae bacterium]
MMVLLLHRQSNALKNIPMKKSITFRERQVLQCLAEGLTSKETAKKLFLSQDTIKTYRSRLLIKLQAKNAFQLGMKCVNFEINLSNESEQLLKVV